MPPASPFNRQAISDSDVKDACLAILVASAASRLGFRDWPRLIAMETWDLLINAIYSAPFDEHSQAPGYAKVTRDPRVTPLTSEYVQLTHVNFNQNQALGEGDYFGGRGTAASHEGDLSNALVSRVSVSCSSPRCYMTLSIPMPVMPMRLCRQRKLVQKLAQSNTVGASHCSGSDTMGATVRLIGQVP